MLIWNKIGAIEKSFARYKKYIELARIGVVWW